MLGLTCKSSPFWVYSCMWCQKVVCLPLFCMYLSISPTPFIKSTVFTPWCTFAFLATW